MPKVTFSEPVTKVDGSTFTLTDAAGQRVPASVHQIGEGTWGLFPHRVFLTAGETYTARVAPGVCRYTGPCTTNALTWSFTVAAKRGTGRGDTTIPAGFARRADERADTLKGR